MINSFITYIENVLLPLGAWGVFLATLIEQIIAPIPSAFVQLGSGFFLVKTESFLEALWKVATIVAVPSAIAVGIGSVVVYYIAYFIGKPFVDKFGSFLGVSWQEVLKIQSNMNSSRKDDWVVFFLRAMPAVPTIAVDLFCGMVRYSISRYIFLTLTGTYVRAVIFGMVGWSVGELYIRYSEFIAHIEKYILFGAVLAVIIFVFVKRYNNK
ncbi:MAG: VTT domain-containing protein [Candidatus Pacebacteria bacterium]|nr:VTT domain-containing protein [Candidatus Paceibacterota bacterium]